MSNGGVNEDSQAEAACRARENNVLPRITDSILIKLHRNEQQKKNFRGKRKGKSINIILRH